MSESVITIAFEVFLIAMILNVALTITYAIYLAIEEKRMVGFISTRRLLESALTITGAISSATWFMIIFIVFYGPILFGAVASAIAVLLTYSHNHFLPSKLTELVATGNILALSIVAYYVGGPTLVVFVLVMIITSFVIAEGLMELIDKWLG